MKVKKARHHLLGNQEWAARSSKKFIPFVNNFCPRRSLDTSRFVNYFIANGWQPTRHISEADLIFIYSCGCFMSSEKRTLNTIRTAMEQKSPQAKIVVTGCLIKINKDVLRGDYEVLPVEKFNDLDAIITAKQKLESFTDANIIHPMRDLISPRKFLVNKFKMDVEFSRLFFRKVKSLFFGRTKYKNTWNIKIANGCMGDCTYCAVRIAAGRVKSKAPDEVIREFKQGLKQGADTFVLINNDVGSYGQDIGTNIAELLQILLAVDGAFKLRIIDLNPRWLIRYFDILLPLLKRHQDKIAYLSMPVQSGSNRMLEKMHRHYTIEEITHCFSTLQTEIPGLVINTHFIVGFPGETEHDFQLTREFAQSIKFGRISIHPYNDRPKTPSSRMEGKVDQKTIFKRYRALLSP